MTGKDLLNYLVQLENDGQDLTKLEVQLDGCAVQDIDHDSLFIQLET